MPAKDSLRTFVALTTPCPPSLARLLKGLASLGPALKCSSPRGLHCTLRFLGDTSSETAVRLGPAIESVLADVPGFRAEISGLGAFPSADRPNVIWAGLHAASLNALFERVESVAAAFGFPPDRLPFRPHVTLARVKRRPQAELQQLLAAHKVTCWGEIEVDSVELFQSTLTPAGPRYDVLHRCTLRR